MILTSLVTVLKDLIFAAIFFNVATKKQEPSWFSDVVAGHFLKTNMWFQGQLCLQQQQHFNGHIFFWGADGLNPWNNVDLSLNIMLIFFILTYHRKHLKLNGKIFGLAAFLLLLVRWLCYFPVLKTALEIQNVIGCQFYEMDMVL